MEQNLVAALSLLAGVVGLAATLFATYKKIAAQKIIRVNIKGTEIKISGNPNYAEITKILQELEAAKEEKSNPPSSADQNAKKQ